MKSTRACTWFTAAVLALLLPGCGPADDAPMEEGAPEAAATEGMETMAVTAEESPEIAQLREIAAQFANVEAALAAGYIPDPTGMCVTAEMEGMAPELGAMGIHYFRPDLLGITATEPRVAGMGTHMDFSMPGVLIYEPQADGSLALVALENVVFDAGWTSAGHTSPPSYMGHEYVPMVDDPATAPDEAHGFEPHRELHVWIPRDNPNGMFTPHNPNVTCQHAKPPVMG
jgi:hypothetical protein